MTGDSREVAVSSRSVSKLTTKSDRLIYARILPNQQIRWYSDEAKLYLSYNSKDHAAARTVPACMVRTSRELQTVDGSVNIPNFVPPFITRYKVT